MGIDVELEGSGPKGNLFEVPQRERIPLSQKRRKVLVLSGPTGVGKTALSLQIARLIGGEIISADSMQVYRGMDIGTAKASLEERNGIRHHLIDSREIDEPFNVAQFYVEARQAFAEVFSRDHVPIVVGGTGFYIHALLFGPPQGPPSVPQVREKLQHEMDVLGPLALYQRLEQLDPTYARLITSRDRHKIVRALEIIAITGEPVSSFAPSETPSEEFDFRAWFLYKPRDLLYAQINARCLQMLENGFIAEVERLEKEGLRKNPSAAQAIGYRQCLEYLDSARTKRDWELFVREFQTASRHYAKRQFTWFRKEPLFRWLDLEVIGLEMAVELLIQDYERA